MNEFLPLEDPDSLLPILSSIAFLGAVSDEQRGEICKLLEVGKFNNGDYVTKRGEQPSHIYIIREGKINLELTDDDIVMHKREFKVGDCFGEAALLSLKNNTASFVAAEDSELVALSRKSLNKLRRENPELFCLLILNLARELARKLQFTDEIMLRLGLH